MPEWNGGEIDLRKEWKAAEADEEDGDIQPASIRAVGVKIVAELERLAKRFTGASTLITEWKEAITNDDAPCDIDDFNELMVALYDWGDRHRVWVATF